MVGRFKGWMVGGLDIRRLKGWKVRMLEGWKAQRVSVKSPVSRHWMETDLIDCRTVVFEANLAYSVIGCAVAETLSS